MKIMWNLILKLVVLFLLFFSFLWMDNDILSLERKCLLRYHIPAIPIPIHTQRRVVQNYSYDFPETFGHCSKQYNGSGFTLIYYWWFSVIHTSPTHIVHWRGGGAWGSVRVSDPYLTHTYSTLKGGGGAGGSVWVSSWCIDQTLKTNF